MGGCPGRFNPPGPDTRKEAPRTGAQNRTLCPGPPLLSLRQDQKGRGFMKLPVLKAVGTTFAFVLQHWLDLLKIVWLPLVLLAAISFLVLPGYMQSLMSIGPTGPGVDPSQALAAMSAMLPAAFALLIAGMAAYMIIFAGILKLVIRGEKPSLPFYLGFGADELRLFGTWLLFLLIMIGLEIILAIAAGLAAAAGASISGFGVVMVFAVIVAVCVVMIWMCIRLSLATPAAIGARTIGIGPSWKASKGNAWALFFYWLIWALMLAIIEIALLTILMPGYFQAMGDVFAAAGRRSPDEVQAAAQAMNQQLAAMYDTSSPVALVRLAAGFVIGTILIVVMAVAGGVAWRLMTDESPEKHI
jgi:hypothetical protein